MTDARDTPEPADPRDERSLERGDLVDDPIEQFRVWFAEAEAAGFLLPNAMTLATVDDEGRPWARHVLLRGFDERGFTFYTNLESRKGRQLASHPYAALVFLWKPMDRQVHINGPVTPVEEDEADAYFATRPREAQLGAWASRQSETLTGREELEGRVAEAAARFPGEVPRPPYWSGFRVRPDTMEFWQGRTHRLHDRFLYTEDPGAAGGWTVERLSP